MRRKITVAIEGCCHGMLDNIYRQLQTNERQMGKRVDLLIICGDFQAIRNVTDLECMSCPDKYKQVGGFYRYYSGEKVAPIPTIFVGGNHEAGNHLRELYYGGWVAPNIYYMGNSGVVRFGGLRIGGISGIYKDFDFPKGYYERPPFRGHSRSSMHHVRSYEAFKLMQVRKPLDIVVSHDWPQYIERFGDTQELLRKKPFFKNEVERGDLGSPVNALLLERLRPAWWFSAHMHSRFEATVEANDPIYKQSWWDIALNDQTNQSVATDDQKPKNQDEIRIDSLSGDEDDESPSTFIQNAAGTEQERPRLALNLPPPKHTASEDVPLPVLPEKPKTPTKSETPEPEPTLADPRIPGRATRFLALDKCLPRRQFLEIIDVEVEDSNLDNAPLQLEYDPEWLAILRMCHPYMPLEIAPFVPPKDKTASLGAVPGFPAFSDQTLDKEIRWVTENVFTHGPVYIPPNFVPMAPVPPAGTPDHVSFGLAQAQNRGNGGRGGRGGRGGHRGNQRGGYSQNRGNYGQTDMSWNGPRPQVIYPNPQTDELCAMLGIQDRLTQRRFQDN
ncbi:lariat debranching enzyme [Coemansia sp. IMI 203386]|nr:lariat debranching enzyme [Coemansia sp. IMI 203386]